MYKNYEALKKSLSFTSKQSDGEIATTIKADNLFKLSGGGGNGGGGATGGGDNGGGGPTATEGK